jgi:hypothetical protein
MDEPMAGVGVQLSGEHMTRSMPYIALPTGGRLPLHPAVTLSARVEEPVDHGSVCTPGGRRLLDA